MIGQAGTGSPGVGTARLFVAPRVHVYTFADRDERRRGAPGSGGQTRE